MSFPSRPIVGFVGGVGSGKSTLARRLARRWRVAVLDADAVGHEVLAIGEVQSALRAAFGPDLFDERGQVVRSRLAQRVFGEHPDQQAARQQLEAIVHPVIRRRLDDELRRLRDSAEYDLIILDAAVMLEAGWNNLCDAVVYLDVPVEVRQQRVRESRGWSVTELARREASQWPLDRKRAAADAVLANDGDLAVVEQQLSEFLIRRFPQLPRPGCESPAAAGPTLTFTPASAS